MTKTDIFILATATMLFTLVSIMLVKWPEEHQGWTHYPGTSPSGSVIGNWYKSKSANQSDVLPLPECPFEQDLWGFALNAYAAILALVLVHRFQHRVWCLVAVINSGLVIWSAVALSKSVNGNSLICSDRLVFTYIVPLFVAISINGVSLLWTTRTRQSLPT